MNKCSGYFSGKWFWGQIALALLIFLQFGCKTPQQKLEGSWEIVEYKDHKQDMMPMLKKNYMNEECHFSFPDPESKDGYFSAGNELKDSLILFQASLYYDKPIITFKSYSYRISDWKNQIYSFSEDTTDYKNQLPFYLFDGEWKLNREGKNELELTRTGSNKIYMVFRRKNY